MRKAVIKLKNGDYINIDADAIEVDAVCVYVKNGGKCVAVVKVKELISCHLSMHK